MKKQQQLWCEIDYIEESKSVKHGDGRKYLVHLVNGNKPVWVLPKNLSSGVCSNYEKSMAIPAKSKARVDRGYIKSRTKRALFTQTPEDVLKLARRNSRWIVTASQWHAQVNKVIAHA